MAKEGYFNILVLFTLLLDFASALYISQDSLVKSVGDTFIVICKDKVRGHQVTWRGPSGNKLGQRTRPRVQNSSFGTAVMFNNAKEEDSGDYTCTTSESPIETAVFSLTVEEPYLPPPVTTDIKTNSSTIYPIDVTTEDELRFVDTESIQYLRAGETGTLRCDVNKEDTTITWLFDNGVVVNETILVNGVPKYQKIADGLLIRNVTREDRRNYTCQAVHRKSGAMKTREIRVIVAYVPYAYAKEEVIYAFENATVELTCEVEAEPTPVFNWASNNNGDVFNVSSHKSLLVFNMTEDTQGVYNCSARNTEGILHIYFTLQLAIKPESPTNITLTEVKENSLQLEIDIPESTEELTKAGMKPNWLVVQYRRVDSSDEWNRKEFNITGTTLVNVLLRKLEKNTRYEIQAATKNVGGLSDYYTEQFITSIAPRSVQAILVILSLVSINLLTSSTSWLWNA